MVFIHRHISNLRLDLSICRPYSAVVSDNELGISRHLCRRNPAVADRKHFSFRRKPIQSVFAALAERVGGGGGWVRRSGWQCIVAVAAACRKALVNAGWTICLPSCTNGCRKCSFHLVETPFLAILVRRSVLWSEGPDYWTLANEWVCPRSLTHRECVNKALTQVSGANSTTSLLCYNCGFV